jgi:electron transfer flavoprotein alpha subunit
MDFRFFGDLIEEEIGAGVTAAGGEGYRNVWVAAEVVGGHGGPPLLLPTTLQSLGQARELADQIGAYVFAVLLGQGVESLAQDAIGYGADQVLVADDPILAEYQTELFVSILADLVEKQRPEILLLPGTPWGNDLAPRLAQRLNTGLISHCVRLDLDMSERLLLGTFPVLGGEMYNTAACPEARPQMATLQPGAFRIPAVDNYRSGSVQRVDLNQDWPTAQVAWTGLETSVDLPPVPLSRAKIVVSAGRGMGDGEGLALVERLAAALGGAVGGSRGAFDEGWIPEAKIIGVGGQFISPDLYIACGVSGDIYHYFGVQDSKFIVAINPDAQAPIMKAAHLAVAGDARQVIPAMLEALGS